MTTKQIQAVLDDYGYSFNEKIKFPECSSIYLTTDGNVYPGTSTRFEFSTKNGNELLLVYDGKEDKDGNFIYTKTIPQHYISFSIIAGFTMVGPTHISEPFRLSQSV